MGDALLPSNLRDPVQNGRPWFHRFSRPILFLTVSLALAGAYLASTIPVSVFPNTDFPRVVIGQRKVDGI